jgi:hypothetical protein
MSQGDAPERSDVLAALGAWQQTHPAATLLEIEQEVDRQLGALRASLISAVAGAASDEAVPACPNCGRPMHRDRRRVVRQATAHGGTLELAGQTWRCPACKAGLFPPR